MESFRSGFSSSALARRRGLGLVQGYGIYLTDERLIVTKEESKNKLAWKINGGSLFGTVTSEVEPFLNDTHRTVDELDSGAKMLDVKLDQVTMVELKAPSLFFKGHIRINLKSDKPFQLLFLASSEEFSNESFNAAKTLLVEHLPNVLKFE